MYVLFVGPNNALYRLNTTNGRVWLYACDSKGKHSWTPIKEVI